MLVVAYLGESYWLNELGYCNANTSTQFVQLSFWLQEPIFLGGLSDDATGKGSSLCASTISKSRFCVVPRYQSTREFVVKFLSRPRFRRQLISSFDRVIAENPEAIFWTRAPTPGAILFAFRVLKAKRPLVNHICADVNGAWQDPKYRGLAGWLGFAVAKLSIEFLRRIAKNPLTLNLCTGDKLEAFAKQHAPERTHQLVDIVSQRSDRQIANMSQKTQCDEQFNLLFVGRLLRAKGVFELVGALGQLPEKVHLTIAGAGDDAEALIAHIKRYNLESRVRWVGHVCGDELEQLYASAHLLVVPSRNHFEGFPRVIMEAWSRGVPVLVNDVGGIGAFVKHEINGIILKEVSELSIAHAARGLLGNTLLYNRLVEGVQTMANISCGDYWSKQTCDVVTAHYQQLKVNHVI